jgi:putative peptidoglycan lipid II flippase
MEFPLGVFGIALATAVLPTMSAQAARDAREALSATLAFSLRLSAFIAVPAAVGLVALGEPVVRLLFERGEFGAPEAAFTAQALTGYAVGLPAFSATRIAAQTFYALGDTRTPVLVGLAAVAANTVFAVALMWPFEHLGLALASSLSSYVNLAGLAWLLRRRLGRIGGGEIARSLARTLGAAAALLAWCLGSVAMFGGGAAGTIAALAGGVVVYGAAAAGLSAPELRDLLGMVRRGGPTLPSPPSE